MPYQLDAEETVRESLRRCAREQLGKAIHELRDGVRDDPVEAIHTARKALKKERSLLRLGRAAIPRGERSHANRVLQQAGRRLSAARDADALIESLDRLADRYAGQVPAVTFDVIRTELEQRRAQERAALADSALIGAVADELEGIRAQIDDWELRGDGWSALEPGLDRGYRRGRRAFTRARKKPTAERLHEWRKRAKDLWYHLRVLEPLTPHSVHGHAGDAHELADLLGDGHDHAVLRQRLVGIAAHVGVDVDPVIALVDHRIEQLNAEAFLLGERLYGERPKEFRRRIRRYWDAWRAEAELERTADPSELASSTRVGVPA
jgi:CHAD domain-containing protein